MHTELDDADYAEAFAVRREINTLRRRAHLHPQDPEALDEGEQARLEELEEWEP